MTAADVWTTPGRVLGAARWMPPGRAAMRVGPTLRALVATPLRLGTATGPFLSYGGAVEALRAEVMPGPHWYLAGIGVDPSAQRQGVGSALLQPGLTAAAQRRAARRAADEQRGQPPVLRRARLRGRAGGLDARERPARLGYGQVAVSQPPKRFPDRDEIARVRAEADGVEPGDEGPEARRLAGRVLARRDMGKLVFLDLVDRSGRIQLLCPAARTGEVDVHLGDVVGVTGKPTKSRRGEPSPDRRRARAPVAESARRSRTPSTA